MAVDGINISMNEVSSTADQIRTQNNQLKAKLDEIRTEMNNLAQSWDSDAYNTIRGKVNGLAPRIEDYQQVIESYAAFLNKTVEAYTTAETNINSNASAFK